MPQLFNSVKFTIVSLYRMPIRKPVPLDRLQFQTKRDISLQYQGDVFRVKRAFPALDANIASRLGKSVTQRRQILWSREERSHKVFTTLIDPPDARQPEISEEVLLDHPENKQLPKDEKEKKEGQTKQTRPQSGQLPMLSKATAPRPASPILGTLNQEIKYAEFVVPSYSSSSLTLASSLIDIPPRPKDNLGAELECFLCPLCFTTQAIASEREWRKHVFEDTMPYVCTFGDCELFDHFFEDKKTWYEHELRVHRVSWSCHAEDHTVCKTEEEFLEHIKSDHAKDLSLSQVQLLKHLFRRPAGSSYQTCNLCGRDTKHLENHVARHLEHIALFALPLKSNTISKPRPKNNDSEMPDVAKERTDKGDTNTDTGFMELRNYTENMNITMNSFNITDKDGALAVLAAGLFDWQK